MESIVDHWSLYHASHVTTKPCPFCGGSSLPLSEVNHQPTFGEGPIYRVTVNCTTTRCMASLGVNSRSLAEAREKALDRWNTRKLAGLGEAIAADRKAVAAPLVLVVRRLAGRNCLNASEIGRFCEEIGPNDPAPAPTPCDPCEARAALDWAERQGLL